MAKVPYSPVADVAPSIGGAPTENIQASPADFGGLTGQATEKLGGAVGDLAQTTGQLAIKFQQQTNATAIQSAKTALSQEIGTAQSEFSQLSGNNAVAAFPAYQKKINDIQGKYATQFQAIIPKNQFLEASGNYVDRAMFNMSLHVGNQAKVASINSHQAAIKEAQANVVRYTHAGQEPDFTDVINNSLMLAQEQGLDHNSANVFVQKNVSQAMHDAVVARVAVGDTAGASKMLKSAMQMNTPGTDLPLLDADHQANLSSYITQKQNLDSSKALTDQMRQMALRDKLDRDAAEASGKVIVEKMLADPTKFDPATIANDPNLKYEQKLQLNNALQTELARVQGNDPTRTYGPGFYSAFQAVHAAAGDPSKITDPSALYGMVGPKQPPQFDMKTAPGMVEPGNLDPWNRPPLHNSDGSYSTTSSISVGTNKGETLIPTVVNGKRLSNEDAIAHYKTTGENLGTFKDAQTADDYATKLHNAQATLYDSQGNKLQGNLTLAGVRELTNEISGSRSPEGASEGEMKKQFLANARGQITGTNEGLHIRDPKGDELYLKFMARALPAYSAGRAAGKTPSQLLDPDSADYVGKSITTFKRPMSQWTSDMLSDGSSPATAPVLPQIGEIRQGYRFKGGDPSKQESWESSATTAPVSR